MSIEDLASKALTINEMKELLDKYVNLYENGDSQERDEAYDLVLYLEARLQDALLMSEESHIQDVRLEELLARVESLEEENRVLSQKNISGKDQLSKNDIMSKFNKGSDWALRLLKMMYQEDLAVKINKEYYTTQEELDRYLTYYKGKNLFL